MTARTSLVTRGTPGAAPPAPARGPPRPAARRRARRCGSGRPAARRLASELGVERGLLARDRSRSSALALGPPAPAAARGGATPGTSVSQYGQIVQAWSSGRQQHTQRSLSLRRQLGQRRKSRSIAIVAVRAQLVVELVHLRLGRLHLQLALAHVLEVLGRAQDHVDDRPDEREQRCRRRAGHRASGRRSAGARRRRSSRSAPGTGPRRTGSAGRSPGSGRCFRFRSRRGASAG